MSDSIVRPVVGNDVYIAPSAVVCGAVTLGERCTVMHQVVIRGDVAAIRIGRRVNVQDGTIIHTKTGVPLEIGDDVGIGHRAIVHCRSVGPNSLIGMGAILLDDVEIGEDCLIGAGAVVTPGTVIGPGKVALGMPARVVRDVTDADREYQRFVVTNYLRLGPEHAAGRYPKWSGD